MDMFNSTSSNDEVINIVFRSFLFVFVTLPTSVLSGLCVVAIMLSKTINFPMRVLLLNIFASLLSLLFSKSLFQLVPYTPVLENDFSCKLTFSTGITGIIIEICSVVSWSMYLSSTL